MIKRVFVNKGCNPYQSVQWKKVDVQLNTQGTKRVIKDLQFPISFTQVQCTIAADKYFKLKQVPQIAIDQLNKIGKVPFLQLRWKQDQTSVGQKSFKQLVHRIAGAWAYQGIQSSYFKDQTEAQIFYDQRAYIMINQMFAPNSPQWFNTGCGWAYGVGFNDPGYYYINQKTVNAIQYSLRKNDDRASAKQQVSACYIHQLKDNLFGSQSLTDMFTIQTRLFRNGSGNGFNVSNIRRIGQPLSNGGKTSGMMSFLKIFDRNADVVKSGGRNRRRARNRIVNTDHPQVLDFINWKIKQQQKITDIITGSKINFKFLKRLYQKAKLRKPYEDQITQCLAHYVQPNMIQKTIDLAKQGMQFDFQTFSADFNGEATKTVSGQNANNNIAIDRQFMDKAIKGQPYQLKYRKSGQVAKQVNAGKMLMSIAQRRWKVGDPGLYYLDNTNAWNTVLDTQKITSANPCQQYLNVNNTSCNLGSINLMKFKKRDGQFNRQKFCAAVQVAYLGMQISISMAISPSISVAYGTYNYRPLGMGFMNLGRLLMSNAIPYDSPKRCSIGRTIASLMTGTCYRKSIQIRQKKGPFPLYVPNSGSCIRVLNNHYSLLKGQRQSLSGVINPNIKIDFNLVPQQMYQSSLKIWKKVTEQVKKHGLRNNVVTCIRPTGTIGLMMDSGGTMSSEPQYTLKRVKKLSGGGYLTIASKYVQNRLEALQYTPQQILEILIYLEKNSQTIQGAPYIKTQHLPVFDCAVPSGNGIRSVSIDGHLNMMSAINGFISMGISKTVNVPSNITIKQVNDLFIKGWKMGLKALTIFRDNCRLDSPLRSKTYQFLQKIDIQKVKKQYQLKGQKPKRRRMPQRRRGWTQEATVGGHKIFLRTGQYEDGNLGQIFIDIYKQGSFARTAVNLLAKLSSKRLQYGVPTQQIIDVFLNVNQQPKGIVQHPNIKMSQSIFDFLGRLLAYRYMGRNDLVHKKDKQDQIKQQIIQKSIQVVHNRQQKKRQYLGQQCTNCGSYNMIKNGNCFVCGQCGTTTGCS